MRCYTGAARPQKACEFVHLLQYTQSAKANSWHTSAHQRRGSHKPRNKCTNTEAYSANTPRCSPVRQFRCPPRLPLSKLPIRRTRSRISSSNGQLHHPDTLRQSCFHIFWPAFVLVLKNDNRSSSHLLHFLQRYVFFTNFYLRKGRNSRK